MKFILISLLFLSTSMFAQLDMPASTPLGTDSPLGTQGTFGVDKKETLPLNYDNSPGIIDPNENNFSFEIKDEFANNGAVYDEKYKNKFKGDEGGIKKKRENLYFGDVKSNSGKVNIICRDYILVDGDMISVYLNDKIIYQNIPLEHSYKAINIELLDGFNKIDFVVTSEGYAGGNTAEYKVYDDKGVLISHNHWDNLAKGFKGTVIIVKE